MSINMNHYQSECGFIKQKEHFFSGSSAVSLTRPAIHAGSKTPSYTSFRSYIERVDAYLVSEIYIIAMKRCLGREHLCKAEQPAS